MCKRKGGRERAAWMERDRNASGARLSKEKLGELQSCQLGVCEPISKQVIGLGRYLYWYCNARSHASSRACTATFAVQTLTLYAVGEPRAQIVIKSAALHLL